MTKASDKIKEWNEREYSDSDILFIRQLKARGFAGEELATVLDVLDNVCKHCFDADDSCSCWNDE